MAYTNTFGKPDWFDFVAKEYEACREGVGISDYSSFTKIDLWVNKKIIQLSKTSYCILSLKEMKWLMPSSMFVQTTLMYLLEA